MDAKLLIQDDIYCHPPAPHRNAFFRLPPPGKRRTVGLRGGFQAEIPTRTQTQPMSSLLVIRDAAAAHQRAERRQASVGAHPAGMRSDEGVEKRGSECLSQPKGTLTPSSSFLDPFAFSVRGGRLMFEGHQSEVEQMMQSNAEFRSLYMRHRELDKQVLDAELGVLPLDDMTLVRLKKEKLWAKDKLTHLWERAHLAAAH
jgi:uncharacterized protein YdcH (DUF465 family)